MTSPNLSQDYINLVLIVAESVSPIPYIFILGLEQSFSAFFCLTIALLDERHSLTYYIPIPLF